MKTIMPRLFCCALGVLGLASLGGCARRNVVSRTAITSARMESGYKEAEVAAGDVTLGKYTEALARSDVAVNLAPNNPWARYNRAAALHHLGRSDDAVAEYREAEGRFGKDAWGKSLAVYGRARALDDVGRCDEAKGAYEEFASLTRPTDPGAADMAVAYGQQCRARQPAPGPDSQVVADMTSALVAGNYKQVLELKEKVPATPVPNPWVEYDVASALAGLGKTDEAVAAFGRAESAFGDLDPWGRSVAVWGRARALALGGRCQEARQAFDAYIKTVGSSDPASVRLAETYSKQCS